MCAMPGMCKYTINVSLLTALAVLKILVATTSVFLLGSTYIFFLTEVSLSYFPYLLSPLVSVPFLSPCLLLVPLTPHIWSCSAMVLVTSRIVTVYSFSTSIRHCGDRQRLYPYPARTLTVVKAHCPMADSAPGNVTTFKSRKQGLAGVAKSFHLRWTVLIRKKKNFRRCYPA